MRIPILTAVAAALDQRHGAAPRPPVADRPRTRSTGPSRSTSRSSTPPARPSTRSAASGHRRPGRGRPPLPALPVRPAGRVRRDRGSRRRPRRAAHGRRRSTARGDMAIAYSKRADGTWLIRSKGTVGGSRCTSAASAPPTASVRALGRRRRQARPQGRARRRVQAPQAPLAGVPRGISTVWAMLAVLAAMLRRRRAPADDRAEADPVPRQAQAGDGRLRASATTGSTPTGCATRR